jgi:VanZ family protein
LAVILVWLSLVLLLSIIPTRGLQTGHQADKIIHFVMYGITAVMFLRILRFKTSLTRSIVVSIILASAYGFVIELLQSAVPWRECSFSDMIANISGAALFSILYALTYSYMKKI